MNNIKIDNASNDIENLNNLSISEIYDNCYKKYLEMGKEYKVNDKGLNIVLKQDYDGVCTLNFLKNFNLDENQVGRAIISLLNSSKNIDNDILKYCLINIDMDKNLAKRLTELYIENDIEENNDEDEDSYENDDDNEPNFDHLYNLLLTAKHVDKDAILQVFFGYSHINKYLLDISQNIENVNLLLIAKNYIDNVEDASEIIRFSSLIKINDTDVLDKCFIKYAEDTDDYIKYIETNINKINVKLLTQNFKNIVDDFDDIYKYTQAIIMNEEDMSAIYLIKNKLLSLLEDYDCEESTFISLMKLLGNKLNIDELYNIYLKEYCNDIENIECLINNLDIPKKYIENSDSSISIINILFDKCYFKDIYSFITKYNIFTIEALENKLIQNANTNDIKELLNFYLNIEGLNFEKIQNCIINICNLNNNSYGLYLLALTIKESNKELLFDNYLKLKIEFNVLLQFVKLLDINEERLLKIREYIYKQNIEDANTLYDFCLNYPQIINEEIELKLISMINEKNPLLELYKYVNTFADDYLIKVMKAKDVEGSKMRALYYQCNTIKQKNVLISLIFVKGFCDDTYNILRDTKVLSEDEKFDLLLKFDGDRYYINRFLTKFHSNRNLNELEDLVIQNDNSGKLMYVFATNFSGADKNKLFNICIENNFKYTNNFLKIPNIIIPNNYFYNFDLKDIFYMITDDNYRSIKTQLEKCLMVKDKTGKYIYELLKKSEVINGVEAYNTLSKKNNFYGLLGRSKLKKIYGNLSVEPDIEDTIASNDGSLSLDNSIVEELITNDDLFLRYEKIKFKINKINNNGAGNESIDLVIKNMVQTLNLKKDLLKDELVINELVTYFDSIIIFIDAIIKSNKDSKDFIECSLNEKVAREIRNMSEVIASSAKEIEESNKFIK